jgi:hypothetical protein
METFACPRCRGGHFRTKDTIKIECYREVGFRQNQLAMTYGQPIAPIVTDNWFCLDCNYVFNAVDVQGLLKVFRDRDITWANFTAVARLK